MSICSAHRQKTFRVSDKGGERQWIFPCPLRATGTQTVCNGHCSFSVFRLQKDGDPFFAHHLFFIPFLFFRGYQLGLAGERGDIKKETEQNNQAFFWHQKQYISYCHCCMLAPLSLFPLFIRLFYPFYLFIHLEPFGDADVAAQPSARREHYCVSIESFLMNLLRKLKYCRMGRCGSLSLMHRDG